MNCVEPMQPGDPIPGGLDGPVSEFIELLPSAAAATPVTEIMARLVICVGLETEIPDLMRLFVEQGISGAPVVDGDGKPIGVVSKTDVVRELCENPDAARARGDLEAELDAGSELEFPLELYTGRRVRHIMTPLAIFASEETSIARAAAVMAYEKVHRLLVVDRSGSVRGLVSPIDVLRWLGRQDGYAIP